MTLLALLLALAATYAYTGMVLCIVNAFAIAPCLFCGVLQSTRADLRKAGFTGWRVYSHAWLVALLALLVALVEWALFWPWRLSRGKL